MKEKGKIKSSLNRPLDRRQAQDIEKNATHRYANKNIVPMVLLLEGISENVWITLVLINATAVDLNKGIRLLISLYACGLSYHIM